MLLSTNAHNAQNYYNTQLRHLSYKLWRALTSDLLILGCNIFATHYIAVHELLLLSTFHGFSLQDVELVVQQSYKGGLPSFSFYRDEYTGFIFIRANQLQEQKSPPASITYKRKESKLVQPVDYLCVLDFECTCDEGVQPMPQEIIEFPVVIINTKTLQVEDTFHSYVRPVINPRLSRFCRQLTGIQQSCVNFASPLWEVLAQFDRWLQGHHLCHPTLSESACPLSMLPCTDGANDGGVDSDNDSSRQSEAPTLIDSPSSSSRCADFSLSSKPLSTFEPTLESSFSKRAEPEKTTTPSLTFSIVTDGPCDIQDFLVPNAEALHIPLLQRYPYWNRWINLRDIFARHYGCKRLGIKQSLEVLGLEFIGRPHSGLDDARNLATLAVNLMQHEAVLRENGFLLSGAVEGS